MTPEQQTAWASVRNAVSAFDALAGQPPPSAAQAGYVPPPASGAVLSPASVAVASEAARFSRCLRETLKHEGGYVDHPSDPGGATNLGVTIGTAQAFKLDMDRDGDVDKADVRALTVQAVEPVYRAGYWLKAGCHLLPAGVDMMVFDTAVNSGPKRAVAFLQECVVAKVDGDFGAETLAKVATVPPRALIERYSQRRGAFYRSLPTFATFGKGWTRRLQAVTAVSLGWLA
jgi:lysozyme family protein